MHRRMEWMEIVLDFDGWRDATTLREALVLQGEAK